MRLFGIALVDILLSLTACSGGDEGDSPTPTPTPEKPKSEIKIDSSITTNGVAFKSEAGEQSITFNASDNWTLSIAETRAGTDWVTASATSGNKGSVTIKFTVTENTDYDDRSVAVTIKSGTASTTFTITQKGVDAMLVTTTKYEVPQAGGNIEVEVQANITYQVEIPESSKTWIKETTTRALTTTKHTFEVAANEEYDKREGEIIFKSGDKKETIKVYQAGGALILLTQNEYAVSDKGETITVELKSNCEYGVQMPKVDWIKEETSRATSSHTLKYIIAPNEGYDNRSAEIVYFDKNSDLKETITITQGQKNAIILSNKNVEVDSEGGDITVKLSANVDFEIEMPSVDWITKTDSRALTEHEVKFTIAKNESEEKRSADIVFVNKESGISEMLIISQRGITTNSVTKEGDMWIVTKSKAGNLSELFDVDYSTITLLKIIGPLNSDDIKTLRNILGDGDDYKGQLVTLDLSEAIIVEGGGYYYYSGKYYRTKNNEIGEYMFECCQGLKSIKLPNNVTVIREGAFCYCYDLVKVDFGNGVTTIGNYAFRYCYELAKLTIPDNILEIKSHAFRNCRSLSTVEIGDGVTIIGESAFSTCESLSKISFGKKLTTIDRFAFAECKNLSEIIIPDHVTTLGVAAFENCI